MAYTAILQNAVVLAGQQTVICDQIITSEGGGYDNETGIFTAPVSGTYCFMANSTPLSDSIEGVCRLGIVLDGESIARLSARGKILSTCHAAVQVKAGQKVWLRANDIRQKENRYYGGWGTTFTGMLLQPEL